MRRAVAFVGTVAAALVVAGCGGGTSSVATARSATDARQIDGKAALLKAARVALLDNSRLSLYVLWNNRIPSWATRSTRGPALASLRVSAASRTQQHIQIKTLPSRYQVISLRLDPSYTTATAVVHDQGRVIPYRNGRRLGRSIAVNDRARIQLRRLGKSTQFVVWQVAPLR